MSEGKVCTKCGKFKIFDNFYYKKDSKDFRTSACKECSKKKSKTYSQREDVKNIHAEYNKEKRKNPKFIEESKKRSENFRKSNRGRAIELFNSAKRRSNKFSDIDFDYTYLLDKITKGYCEATGIEFDMEPTEKYIKNPLSPSIDKIDPSVSYKKDNVRIVIWQFNLMKGEIKDDELLVICKKFKEKQGDFNGRNKKLY